MLNRYKHAQKHTHIHTHTHSLSISLSFSLSLSLSAPDGRVCCLTSVTVMPLTVTLLRLRMKSTDWMQIYSGLPGPRPCWYAYVYFHGQKHASTHTCTFRAGIMLVLSGPGHAGMSALFLGPGLCQSTYLYVFPGPNCDCRYQRVQ